MLGLQLREEFRGARLRGTTIDFTNEAKTGALDMAAQDFLRITYPSVDLIKTIKAAAPGSNRAVVLIGDKGQGKSHLMAALCHLLSDPDAGELWLKDWADKLARPELAALELRSSRHVIAEPLHERRFAYLWDLLFARHPNGEFAKGAWTTAKTEVPGKDILVEMFKKKPCALLLDEFQTWFDGLSDAQEPRQVWAFNFIQILSEIAENNPELLTLVVSVREGASNAAQQLFRVNPVRVDFKGEQAQHDRRRLLLYRIFENRINIGDTQIAPLVEAHFSELMRLGQKPASEVAKHRARFIEAWPFSPELLQLLDDEVIFAIKAQGTRDLVRILVELFKSAGNVVPVITPADFELSGDDRGSAAALIDNVGIDHHKQLRDRALRNLTAVEEALGGDLTSVQRRGDLMTLAFVKDASNVVLVGPNGVGKSMCACNIGYQAVLAGHTALFTTAGQLLGELAALDSDSGLRRKLRQYAAPDVLIIDEVGYLSYSNRHADLLFELVSRRYQNKSTVVTTNRAFADWGEVFPNAACVVSLIDRLMHRAEVVRIDGESYRAKEAQEREVQRLAARSAKVTPARSRKAAA